MAKFERFEQLEDAKVFARLVTDHFRHAWQRWSRFVRQPAKVDLPMRRTIHHEDAETVFG